jgi:peptidyl-dipeptidase Dcp
MWLANPTEPAMTAINKAITHWDGPHGLPRFDAIRDSDFRPAFEQSMASHLAEIDAIAGNQAAATFENVIMPLETAGEALSRTNALFWNLAGANTNDTIKALEREMSPLLSRHWSKIAQNKKLFERIDAVWENERSSLGTEAFRVLEDHWKGFVKAGAKLSDDDQHRLAEINERLASLGTAFGQNVLADESSWVLVLKDQEDLAGLPDWLRSAMSEAARVHGAPDGWAVTLSRSIIEPFLTFSERRDLRERAFRAWIVRGEGDNDNRPVVAEILKLRNEKARMLGYANYAALKLDDTMAKTPMAVEGLLKPVWEKAVERAGEEARALEQLIVEEGRNHKVEPWDWRHYAEKRRQREFAFSETELKPYLQLERMIDAAFAVATRLFAIRFRPLPEFKAWHPDVRSFEVLDASGDVRGIFFGDYFNRPSKRSGAWMSSFQSQHRLDGGRLPFIYNIMNFAKAPEGEPVLVSLDDARTLFHEFGHALHGLLSDVTYPSVSGTGVARDFVELPSQLYEHWLTTPQILREFALHHATGEPLPDALLAKVLAARTFNSGFNTVEFTASALVDMAFHTAGDVPDPMAFEAEKLAELSMPSEIVMRHRTPHFQHVFSGDGYSAGYYSYMWSEVLDADAFSAFEETGDPFNPELAARLRQHVYAAGGSRDPEELYKAFRGSLPSPKAMMEKRGLA